MPHSTRHRTAPPALHNTKTHTHRNTVRGGRSHATAQSRTATLLNHPRAAQHTTAHHSVQNAAHPGSITFLAAAAAIMRFSTLWGVTRRKTSTGLCWPMRWQRSMACWVGVGSHGDTHTHMRGAVCGCGCLQRVRSGVGCGGTRVCVGALGRACRAPGQPCARFIPGVYDTDTLTRVRVYGTRHTHTHLRVCVRVPVRVEEHHRIGRREVDAQAASARGQQEQPRRRAGRLRGGAEDGAEDGRWGGWGEGGAEGKMDERWMVVIEVSCKGKRGMMGW
jgi:hypothetical protein